ncbi:hypothetical protein GCM10009540_64440 [Streptomyces turgidiscabies]
MTTFSFDVDASESSASFSARLLPSEAAVLYGALILCARAKATDAYLTLLLGAGRDVVDSLLARLLPGPPGEPFDIRLRPDELHVLLSALTNAAIHFVRPDGQFDQESFHIRLGHFRQESDALAMAITKAAYLAHGPRTTPAVTE